MANKHEHENLKRAVAAQVQNLSSRSTLELLGVKKVHKGGLKKGQRIPSQYKKGQSGNPGGKPKVFQRMAQMYAEIFMETIPPEFAKEIGLPPGKSWFETICRSTVRAACKADIAAVREVREVTEGKIPERVAFDLGAPPVLHVHFVDPPVKKEG